jgi:hypothetical protein
MLVRDYLEKGRSLAERIPYSFHRVGIRLAVADSVLALGQTKVNASRSARIRSICSARSTKVPLLPPESGGLSQHHRRARFSVPAVRRDLPRGCPRFGCSA